MGIELIVAAHPGGEVSALTYWHVCGWFMLGVLGNQLWRLMGYFRKPAAERDVSVGQCLAGNVQGLIAGFCLSWVWVGGHLWALLATWQDELPILQKIPVVDSDQLGSVFIGFVLSWLLIPWLVGRFGMKKK